MKIKSNFIPIAMLVALGFSCTNLDENLQDTYTQKFTDSNHGVGVKNNANRSQPNDNMAPAFNNLLNGIATNGGFFAIQEGGTDEAVITQKGGDWYDGGLYIRIHQHQFTPQTWAINDTWNQQYNGIYQCNALLSGANAIPNISANQKAQLRFLRAYFYWRLMDVFGNVPIVTSAGAGAAQSTRAQVFSFVENEVKAAIPDLVTGLQDYARVNQAGAYAFLSRLYLNAMVYTGTARYQDASDAADKVINSGLYTLASNFADVFSPSNCCNDGATKEILFTVPFDEATGGGATWPHMTLHYPSQLTYNLTAQPWNGFSTLEDFYNSFDDTDKRKKASFIAGAQYQSDGTTPILDLAFTKGDPDGAPIVYKAKINELYPNAWRSGGARFGKFSFKQGQNTNADNDFPLLRYGEVLLNKAEALQRLNNNWSDATALTYVNMLRTRAGATTFSSMTADQMLAERGREMFIEAVRRTDMIRFNKYFGSWWQNPGDPSPSTHSLMAIPIEQMNSSASTSFPLKQNPGY